MDRKFNYGAAVLSKLIWKCDMTNEEIHDVYRIMETWLAANISEGYEWYTPAYSRGEVTVVHNGERFYPCVSFKLEEDLGRFNQRFGCIK